MRVRARARGDASGEWRRRERAKVDRAIGGVRVPVLPVLRHGVVRAIGTSPPHAHAHGKDGVRGFGCASAARVHSGTLALTALREYTASAARRALQMKGLAGTERARRKGLVRYIPAVGRGKINCRLVSISGTSSSTAGCRRTFHGLAVVEGDGFVGGVADVAGAADSIVLDTSSHAAVVSVVHDAGPIVLDSSPHAAVSVVHDARSIILAIDSPGQAEHGGGAAERGVRSPPRKLGAAVGRES